MTSKRVQRKAKKKSRSSRVVRRAPQTAEDFFARSEREQETWASATHVIAKMRSDEVSLLEASREFGIDPRTVARLVGPALKRGSNGRYAARAKDSLLRVLVIPTNDGLQEIALRDSRQASQLGEYWAAVQKYLETGNESALRKIRRKTITDIRGKRFRLLKEVGDLDRLGSAGVLSFESLYAKAA